MNQDAKSTDLSSQVYYVDEAGDGVLFGSKGRIRLSDPDAPKFFMLGMVSCSNEKFIGSALEKLRQDLLKNPLYSSIPSLKQEENKTFRFFHAKDDHSEIRAKVFELLVTLDFKFFAVIKDMRAVLDYVQKRNQMDPTYRYHPNELYDLTVRMLFKQRLHTQEQYEIVFARRGHSDRTSALRKQLEQARLRYLEEKQLDHDPSIEITPSYPWIRPGLQLADYCLWALQRCYEKHEARFIQALWPKVSLVRDVDDASTGKKYGSYLTNKGVAPDPEKIKIRRI